MNVHRFPLENDVGVGSGPGPAARTRLACFRKRNGRDEREDGHLPSQETGFLARSVRAHAVATPTRRYSWAAPERYYSSEKG
jgi:hypothetical protein